ncbi:BBE domain-containing protein [Micromonospora sp. NPDC049301]|uniref:BBE domain-containing protein n=1 Tax=Micromonospora sp. NPDC049301 TaxID=3155723 RepID=UPI0034167FC9
MFWVLLATAVGLRLSGVAKGQPKQLGTGWSLPVQLVEDPAGRVSSLAADEGQRGVCRAYPAAKLARLTALKSVWDPQNVFHLNHNIRPAVTAGRNPGTTPQPWRGSGPAGRAAGMGA